MSIEIVILLVLLFLALQAFFAGSEIALISCDKIKMRSLAEDGSAAAGLVLDAYSKIESFIGTTLIGVNLSLIINTLVLTFYFEEMFGQRSGIYTVALLSPLIVVFGQVVPKAVFESKRNSIVLWVIYPLWVFSKLFYPVLFFVGLFTRGMKMSSITREELEDVVEEDKNKPSADYKRRVLRRIFGYSETTVGEIMIPLVKVDALEKKSTLRDVKRLIAEKSHSRIPIFSDRVDNITGILNSFYVLGEQDLDKSVEQYARPPFYVPESKLVNELMDEMKGGRAGMAVVVDEYGGSVGIITLEDIIEEVVGEIEDEYDTGQTPWRNLGAGQYLIDPTVEIERLNDGLGLAIPEGEDYETLGGFLLYRYGSIPAPGTVIVFGKKTFTVVSSTVRMINEVHLRVEK
ncbi:MAG: HlyC/CorC family transporter [Candidatus Dadabacteria bacterium]|nr:HlyC/CorC family transporter [Candidatus Dadabacteria bacterium]MYA48988.1 HlyC/CorC family transporter [Candidatus Dadabacteria bacterium]MYF48194.1 HlyC/CorC family transporter [Candidatus Dadabacteria bacterium]MYG82604.1 HlyC/CorC family transporter [Candidatus Dadabacteria bacterium]MYK49497.1 HlyC/CorC family transporter [Candidatus Dadabacteria bacterium]